MGFDLFMEISLTIEYLKMLQHIYVRTCWPPSHLLSISSLFPNETMKLFPRTRWRSNRVANG